jgi:hypothetical protein
VHDRRLVASAADHLPGDAVGVDKQYRAYTD